MLQIGRHRFVAPALSSCLLGVLALSLGLDGVMLMLTAALGAAFGSYFLVREPGSDLDHSVQPIADANANGLSQVDRFAVLDALPIGVLVIGADQTVKVANKMMRDVFGLPVVAGYPIEALRVRRLLEAIAQARQTGADSTIEVTLSRGQDAVLDVHLRPMPRTGEFSMIIAAVDITKARLADEVHRDFVANASHELKTPLAVVSGLIDTLQGPAKDDPVAAERFLGRLATQTQRMTRLIDELMSLNRIELNARVLPSDPVDLSALRSEVVHLMRPAAEASDVSLVLRKVESTSFVLADREELSQLFSNLIDNAIKYGGSGKEVVVRLINGDETGSIGISVRDQGPGIAREHIPRLTERFYRVDIGRSREQGGTGLGLAICKHIVNRHRGRIEIESKPGEGSRFTVWLPLTDVPDSSAEAQSVPVETGA